MNDSHWLSAWFFGESQHWVSLTLALLHFLWVGCLVAIVVTVLGWALRSASARARYLLNVSGLLVLAACLPATYALLDSAERGRPMANATNAASSPLGVTDGSTKLPSSRAANQSPAAAADLASPDPERRASTAPRLAVDEGPIGSPARPSSLDIFAPYVATAYLIGVALMLARLTLALWGGRRLRLSAEPVRDIELLEIVGRNAKRIGLATAPAIAWCRRTAAPVVVGIVRPVVLLPASLATGLDAGQLESLIVHELAHIRRFDLLVNLMQRLIESALFFHPAVWYVSRRVSVEREHACDDLVLAAGWPRLKYADALIRMAELAAAWRAGPAVAQAAILSASGKTPTQFKRRVLRLLGQEPAPALVLNRVGVAGLILAAAVLLAAPIVVRSPAATEPEEPRTVAADDPPADTPPSPDAWPQFGGSPLRNHASPETDVPRSWDPSTGRNIKWTAGLGTTTYGSPIVAQGKVLIGTNNGAGRVARFPNTVDLSCLQCFDQLTGGFLWQFSSEKLPAGRVHDWPEIGLCATACVAGDRVWLVTNRCEIVCLDLNGFRDQENDGPFVDEPSTSPEEADVVWRFDLIEALGVSPLHQSASSVTLGGDLVLANTSNGVGESHTNVIAPSAPSFVALDRQTGRLVWSDATPGQNILPTCPTSSPAVALLGGVRQAIFAGGDGWVYSFDVAAMRSGETKLLWKFDCNPKTSQWIGGGRGDRNSLIAAPVIYEGRVYISVGRSPEEGEGEGRVWCIDPTKRGDISPELVFNRTDPTRPIPHKRQQACDPAAGDFTRANGNSGAVWQFESFDGNGDGAYDFEETMHRAVGSVALVDGLAFVADLSGILHCLDARTGRAWWSHDLLAATWSTPLIVEGKVYIADEDGDVAVFQLGRTKQLIAEFNVGSAVYGSFAAADETLFVATRTSLIAAANADPPQDALKTRLDAHINFKVANRPLIFVLDELTRDYHVPTTVSLKDMLDRGVSPQTPVSLEVSDVPLRDVLNQLLDKVGLDYEVQPDGIRVPRAAKQGEKVREAVNDPPALSGRIVGTVPEPLDLPKLAVELNADPPQPIGEHGVRVVYTGSTHVSRWSLKAGAKFDVEFLPEDAGRRARLLIDIPGFTPLTTADFAIGPQMPPLAVELEPAMYSSLRGRVIDADDGAVDGAGIRVRRIFFGSTTEIPWGVETKTGADGRFELSHLRVGELISVRAELAGVGQVESNPFLVDKGDGVQLTNLRIGPADREVTGRVTDQFGMPVPNAAVEFVGDPKRAAVTDADGRFRLTGLAEGRLELSLTADDGSRASRYVMAGMKDFRLFLPLKSRVTRPEDLLTVSLRTADGVVPSRAEWFLLDQTERHCTASAEFDAQGRCSIDLRSQLRQFGDHKFAIVVFAEGYAASAPIPLETSPRPEPVVVDLQPSPAITLRGRAVDERGAPIAGATVGLSRMLADGIDYEDWKFIGGLPPKLSVTAADGSFEIPGLSRGSRVAVYVNKTGDAGVWSQRIALGEPDVVLPDLELRKAERRISGRVLSTDDHPISGADVRIHDLGGAETTTDSSGRFMFSAAPDGDLLLVACALGYDDVILSVPAAEAKADIVLRLEPDPDQFVAPRTE